MVMNAEELRVAGAWLVQLRKILQLGPSKGLDGKGHKSEHRSTKKGVETLLSNLTKGSKALHDLDTSKEDIQRAIFNAVDLLVSDKLTENDGGVEKSKTGKTRLDVIDKFQHTLDHEFSSKKLDNDWKGMIDEAIQALRFEMRHKEYESGDSMSTDERKTFRKDMFTTEEGQKALTVDPKYACDFIKSVSKHDKTLWDDQDLLNDKKFVATLQTVFKSDKATPEAKKIISDRMLNTDDGKRVMAANPILGAAILSDLEKTNQGALKNLDFDQMFGKDKKGPVVGETLLTIVSGNLKEADKFTGELFTKLHQEVDEATWNDEGEHKRGLGPRICQALWAANCFDELCTLVEHGVDTSLTARVDGEKGPGIYSGFVQPIQHVTSKLLRDIAKMDEVNEANRKAYEKLQKALIPRIHELSETYASQSADWKDELSVANQLASSGDYENAIPALTKLAESLKKSGGGGKKKEMEQREAFEKELAQIPRAAQKFHSVLGTKSQFEGAKKLYETLDKKGGSVTVTTWKEVKESEMIAEFEKNPGTIWGFEHIRMPYVQAAHETEHGNQPLRMMELWSAVEKSFPPDEYEKLLADPKGAAKKMAKDAAESVTTADITDLKKFRENFEKDAESFLVELATQMPKGMFTSKFVDVTGVTPTRPAPKDPTSNVDVRLSDVTGVGQDKYSASFACKVGLWWAKKEGKPLYYCLDGINMDDAINYKKVKNQAIQDFIDGGGVVENAKGHGEVVTMQEIREILKNWDDLKDTVKFTLKGKVFAAEEAQKKVTVWKQKMEDVNKQVGRAKAPPKATFANALNELNKKLLDKIPDSEEGNMDARDIVKKCGYLKKVAKTRPELVLKYIEGRCSVLQKPEYGLLSHRLGATAAAYKQAEDNEVEDKKKLMLKEIKNCHSSLQLPLKSALLQLRT